MMLNSLLLPQLTMEVVPQALYTIMTSLKQAKTSLMGVQQHTMIIYIKISSEVTNTSTLILTRKVFSLFHNHQHIWSSLHHEVIESSSQLLPSSYSYRSSNGTIYHRKFLQIQPFFMLGVGLVLIQNFITYLSKPCCRDYPGP